MFFSLCDKDLSITDSSAQSHTHRHREKARERERVVYDALGFTLSVFSFFSLSVRMENCANVSQFLVRQISVYGLNSFAYSSNVYCDFTTVKSVIYGQYKKGCEKNLNVVK